MRIIINNMKIIIKRVICEDTHGADAFALPQSHVRMGVARAKQVISQRIVTHDDEEDVDDLNSVAIRLYFRLFIRWRLAAAFLIQRKFKEFQWF
jgi:hypothetical protein